jgi:hypothetical protein
VNPRHIRRHYGHPYRYGGRPVPGAETERATARPHRRFPLSAKRTPTRIPDTLTRLLAGAAIAAAGTALAAAGVVGAGTAGPLSGTPGHLAAGHPHAVHPLAAAVTTAAPGWPAGTITLTAYGAPGSQPRPARHGPGPEQHHPGRHHARQHHARQHHRGWHQPGRHRPGPHHRRWHQPGRHRPGQHRPGLYRTPQQIAWTLLPSFHWAPWQFHFLDLLWIRESGWNPYASNPASGAYGIPQAMPGDKMASAGPDWRSSARTQILWGMGYIRGRYVTPYQAWQHELRYGWY